MQILDPLIKWRFCGKPVLLEEAKVNENGKPIHQECYIAKLKFEKRRAENGA